MCQMPNIWHICHTKHKKYLPSDMLYMPKLYHFCPYRCKFATVWTEMVNRNIVFNSAFSLLSLLVFIFSLLLTSNPHQTQLLPQQRKNKMWRSGLGHGGDRFWYGSRWRLCLRVTVEIGFGYGSRWRLCLRVTVEIVFEIGFGF